MKLDIIRKRGIVLCSAMMMAAAVFTGAPAFADTVDEENLITDVNVPENGVIQYDVTVPAGSTVNYAVELTPDEETGTIDSVAGMWKNTTRKAVTKTITAKVKFLSGEYTISATYTSNSTHQTLEYKDEAKAVKSYEESTVNNHISWDTGSFEKLKDVYEEHRSSLEQRVKKIYDYMQ